MANILLVEDDHAMLNFLVKALENASHIVTPKSDGMEALEAINNPNNNFDLLLTDIVIPGIDGIELAKKAADANPDVRIMFITGFSAMATKQEKQGTASNSKLMSKPFHLNDLIEQVETLLKTSKS